jgi:type III restriction enzyme
MPAPGTKTAASAPTPTKQILIENPILNSPFEEPKRHFKFTEDGITDEIVSARRLSSYFVPIPRPKKKGKQLVFDTEWTEDRIKENKWINELRARVAKWRLIGYQGATSVTKQLLAYWQRPERERRLFYCQIEALETAIYITEVASRFGDTWIENDIRQQNASANPLLYRIAFKMATGSGKTVVMAMLIAWNTLNKLADKQDARFSDAFLIVTPGITIRDRLRVLLPNDPQNYYKFLDIVPAEQREQLEQAKIIITNFHACLLREQVEASKLTKAILSKGNGSAFTETPDQMVRRVCRELGGKKNIIVINDEAHHCYRSKPDGEEGEKLKGDERKEAEKRDREARVWISGLEAVKSKIGIRVIYDLSATPFFLRGSGYSEGTLFPWVVSDFSLIDAIESGIVKVPRVPVADDSMKGDQPTYRDLWLRIREHLPKKGRGTEALTGEPKLPAALQGALHSLYSNYEKSYREWEQNSEARARGLTPPVFIVVCNNTNVSKLVFDYVAGWDKTLKDDSTIAVPGKLDLFSNVQDGRWLARPNTILIDSEQLESGEGMSDEFKKIAAREVEEFKSDYRRRFPGRDADQLTDEDLLREVMNTVGKAGKLGEQIKCVVSVSMLTEGWDANTVTHILGVRAFGTQLLCEQVVGRGLRRMSYAANEENKFSPEYAEVYGVPFSFIPCAGAGGPVTPKLSTRVRALEERIGCEITFPRVIGYRYKLPTDRLEAKFTQDSFLAISTSDLPTKTENAPIVGESSIHTLDDLKRRREQEVAFLLAKLTLEKYFRQDCEQNTDRPKEHKFDSEVQAWLFPQLLNIARRWMTECVAYSYGTFPQMLLLLDFAYDAADRIYQSIVRSTAGEKTLLPILRPYETVGSTRYVDFDTTRPVYATRADRSHVSHVVADTESWEQKMAQALEDMEEVLCYVKNQNLGFTIPYTLNGEERLYYPDFLVRIKQDGGEPLNLIVEVSGESRKDKAAKVATARTLWVPAMNNHGGFGRWAFVEVTDPWDAPNTIRAALSAHT